MFVLVPVPGSGRVGGVLKLKRLAVVVSVVLVAELDVIDIGRHRHLFQGSFRSSSRSLPPWPGPGLLLVGPHRLYP